MANWFTEDERQDGYAPITLAAHDLVFGERNKSYGHPLDDFSCTALLWTAYLRHRGLLPLGEELTAEDVGPLMSLVKLSRQANAPKRDNMVDLAGYAETTERVIFERARREARDARLAAELEKRWAEVVTEAPPVKENGAEEFAAAALAQDLGGRWPERADLRGRRPVEPRPGAAFENRPERVEPLAVPEPEGVAEEELPAGSRRDALLDLRTELQLAAALGLSPADLLRRERVGRRQQ